MKPHPDPSDAKEAFSLTTLGALLQQKATKANWRAIIKYLQKHLPELTEEDCEATKASGITGLTGFAGLAGINRLVAEATHKWPAWVRYAERPARMPFPCPALVGELYATIKAWKDPVVTREFPEYTHIQTLSLQLPLALCEDLPTQLLAPFPALTKCILWAGHPDLAVPDPFVARNAFWALQNNAVALFHAHPPLEELEVNVSAAIDFYEECIHLEASATRARGEPWITEERWQKDIAAWQYALDRERYGDEEDDWY